jgi:hypothetical protein
MNLTGTNKESSKVCFSSSHHRHGQMSSLSLAGRGIRIGASPAQSVDGGVGLGAEEWGAAAAVVWWSSRTMLQSASWQEVSAQMLGSPGSSEGCSWRQGPAAFVLGGGEDGDSMARLVQAGCAAQPDG